MNLYESIDEKEFEALITWDDSFMAYCPNCERETTFRRSEWFNKRVEPIEIETLFESKENIEKNCSNILKALFDYDEIGTDKIRITEEKGALLVKEYQCCLSSFHRKYEIFYRDRGSDKIIKIGQYPSAYDTASQEYLEKLKVVCGNRKAKEMSKYVKKALTMESFGYGIPALLYMRRAFEQLISISEEKNELENTGEKMFERIKNNPLLPKEIKENARLYNIISEGIHNETEEECMELFKLIKIGFTILLRKTYEHVQEQKELKELSKLVSSK